MTRKQFTFYKSFYEGIENLRTNSEKLQAYRAICQYALYGQKPQPEALKPAPLAVFSMAQPILDTARKRARVTLSDNNLLPLEKDKE